MFKDLRFIGIGALINQGKINSFQQIYDHLKITYLMSITGANFVRIQMLKEHPSQWTIEELYRLAEALDMEPLDLVKLLHNSIPKENPSK